MKLRELEYIVAVADLRHFGKAALQCNVSQPTLSSQIKKLEEELGATIFERTSRHVMPTQLGNQIIRSARRMLLEADHIRDTALWSKNPFAGRYRIGAFPTLASYIFPDLVPLLKQDMPDLRLIFVEEKSDVLIEKLHKGKLDAAFLALPIKDETIEVEPLFTDTFFLAVSTLNELAKCKSIGLSILNQHKLLLLEEGHCLRDQSLEVCELVGVSDDADMRATSLETLRQMVRANTGVTLMPEIATWPSSEGIKYIPFKGKAPFRMIGLARRKTCTRGQVSDKIISLVRGWHGATWP